MYSDGGDSTAVVAISDGCELIMCSKHGRRSAGGQGDMSPLLFEVEGTPYVLSPLLFGSRHCLLFEELLILTVTPCIGIHCSNFHEI